MYEAFGVRLPLATHQHSQRHCTTCYSEQRNAVTGNVSPEHTQLPKCESGDQSIFHGIEALIGLKSQGFSDKFPISDKF